LCSRDETGEVDKKLVENNLIFTGAKIDDTIKVAMPKEDAKNWFGVAPPDLSVIARVRGADWLYTYLTSFYQDDSRPWGTNNLVYKDTAMPNVLLLLQGVQVPIKHQEQIVQDGVVKTYEVIDHLKLVHEGSMHHTEFNAVARDIVNFLVYVGEPIRLHRESLGIWVLAFLGLLFIVLYLLKKEYWKSVK